MLPPHKYADYSNLTLKARVHNTKEIDEIVLYLRPYKKRFYSFYYYVRGYIRDVDF